MLPSEASIQKITKPPPDPHTISKQSFTHYKCEVIIQLLRNKTIYKELKGLIDTGATSSLATGDLFLEHELEDNLLPVTFQQQKSSFTTTKYAISHFKLPQFTENSVISFPMHVDLHHDCDSPYQFILGLDAILELGITIDGINKSIIWEGTSIPIKQISIPPLLSNELTIGKPNFAIIQHISHDHKVNNLRRIIHDKESKRSRNIDKKSFKFINHCVKYMGLLNSLFTTVNALWQNTPVTSKPIHYYSTEDTNLNSKLYNSFDFSKPSHYNDNVFRLNTLNERYNPMPMYDADMDTNFVTNYADKWDMNLDNVDLWWDDAFSHQEFLFASKSKPVTQTSNYHTHTINDVLNNHSELNKHVKTLLKETLLPFETLFDEKLGTYTGDPLHFRLKPNANTEKTIEC